MDLVFPTCVGVFPSRRTVFLRIPGLPHVRGGVSREGTAMLYAKTSSPRAWGCFLHRSPRLLHRRGLPHVRGGVSDYCYYVTYGCQSSPRAWGCFLLERLLSFPSPVFPTCVGVFPPVFGVEAPSGRLPHVRGGVSIAEMAWKMQRLVFPTCVGVFPINGEKNDSQKCLPHVRGGVSASPPVTAFNRRSSPRAWGCFSTSSSLTKRWTVFPTCVGVFLKE